MLSQYPWGKIDTTTAWKKLCFVLLDRLDFDMIDYLLIAIHAFTSRIFMSFSVDEMLLLRYMNLSIDFREPPFRVEISFLIKTHVLCFVSIDMEANTLHVACYRLCSSVVCIRNFFGGVLSAFLV